MPSKHSTSHNLRSGEHSKPINTVPYSDGDRARFWAKVDRRGDHECWPWTSQTQPSGYGMFSMGGRLGQPKYAHRVSYELAHGPIPKGAYILHRCHQRSCVNPVHLYAGDQFQNMRDAQVAGSLAHPRKRNRLIKQACIDRYLAGGYTMQQLAEEYGVHKLTVCRWLKGLHEPYPRHLSAMRKVS